jgi:hypothetical protein
MVQIGSWVGFDSIAFFFQMAEVEMFLKVENVKTFDFFFLSPR